MNDDDDDMAPITRKELREELAPIREQLEQLGPIKAELAQLGPIKEQLEQLGPIKEELAQHRSELDGLHRTMAYLVSVVESGFREMRDGFRRVDQRFETFRVEFRAELNADMASQVRSMSEQFRTWFGAQDDKINAVDEKYASLPGRVAALEDPSR